MENSERSRRNQIIRELRSGLDPVARQRSDEIAVLAVAVGERLGLPDDGLLDLRYAAELFDLRDSLLGIAFLRGALALIDGGSVDSKILSAAMAPDDAEAFGPEIATAVHSVLTIIQPVDNK